MKSHLLAFCASCLVLVALGSCSFGAPLPPEEWREQATLKMERFGVHWLVFSPDGKTLASAGADKTVRLWDVSAGKETATLEGHSETVTAVAFSPDGKTLASAGNDHLVRLWVVATGRNASTFGEFQYGDIEDLRFSPDGKTLAIGASRRCDLETGKDTVSSKGDCSRHAVVYTSDGKLLAARGRQGRTLSWWDVVSGKEFVLADKLDDFPNCWAFSPDGKVLAFGFRGGVQLYDLTTGKRAERVVQAKRDFWALAFSPDGKTLAAGHQDPDNHKDVAILMVDLTTGKEIASLTGHTAPIECVAFSPDGKTLASAGWDRTIRLWTLVPKKTDK